jgi:hypothetical protein
MIGRASTEAQEGPAQGKALVIGAQGVIGGFLARALREAGWEVTRGGRRPERSDDFRWVDLDREDTVVPACAEADLVVSSVYHPALFAERTVLRDGGVLLHLEDLPPDDRARLREEAPDPRGLVVDRTGLGGVTGLALAEMLRDHPEADAAEFGLILSAAERVGPRGGIFVHSLLRGPTHHRTVTVELPEPFGRRRCMEAAPRVTESLLGDAVGARARHLYLRFEPRPLSGLLRALNGLRLLSRLPQAAFTLGSGKAPEELSAQPTYHWVLVRREGEPLASAFVRGNGDYRSTVSAMVVLAGGLVPQLGAEPPRTGVRRLDELLSLSEIEPALHERGISITRGTSA